MLTVHVLGNIFTAWRSVSVLVIIVDNDTAQIINIDAVNAIDNM